MTFHQEIQEAEARVEELKGNYLRRWGWILTCNIPGSYWMWRRDFAAEDAERHRRWRERGPGPLGWPSEPKPYGVITAGLDQAVSITARALDEQPELGDGEEEG